MHLFSLPYAVLMALFVAVFVAAGCGGHALVRRYVSHDVLVAHNDVAGFMISIVGVLYAVLLAFVVVVVWQQYDASDGNYGDEVSAVADIHNFARSLPRPQAAPIQALAHRYIAEMIGREWPDMLAGGSSAKATLTLAELSRRIAGLRPQDIAQSEGRTHLSASVQKLFDLRERRLADNTQTLPPVLWTSLVIGAIVTIGFGYLFGVAQFRAQLLMTAAVATLIAVLFTVLIELDFPFRRANAISDWRWRQIEHYLDISGDAAFRPHPAPAGIVLIYDRFFRAAQ